MTLHTASDFQGGEHVVSCDSLKMLWLPIYLPPQKNPTVVIEGKFKENIYFCTYVKRSLNSIFFS